MKMSANRYVEDIAKNHSLRIEIVQGVSLTELTAQLNDICEQAEDRTHGIIILEFPSRPLDLVAWPGRIGIQDVNRWERAVRRLERLAALIIAVASGSTDGPALDLLVATDYRIATPNFRLYIPINDGHVWPGMAIHRLVNQVGVTRGRQLLMGGHEITAQRAFDIGLIDEISDVTLDAVRVAVSRLYPMSSTEISIRRQLLLEATTTTFEDAIGTHLAACDRELRRLRGRDEEKDQRHDGR